MSKKVLSIKIRFGCGGTCRLNSNCPLVGPGAVGGMPSVGGLSKVPISRSLQ